MLITKSLHLDGVQGYNEKRMNRTIGAVGEARKQSTQQSAKNAGRVFGYAKKQTSMLRGFV